VKDRKLQVLLTVDPELPVPPGLYGGIERIVEVLVHGLVGRGHIVTLCANKASEVPCRLVPWPGTKSQRLKDTLKNTATLTTVVLKTRFDVIHSFSRLAYMTALMPLRIPKIMSYQREPSLQQVRKAVSLAKKGSLVFTGCSDYISHQIAPVAEAYTIYNCAPIERYTLKTVVDEDAPLMFLGRIEDIKGTHVAVEVARKTGKRLIIAGNIPAEGVTYFETMIKPWLDDRIVYMGPVNDEQKNKWLGESSALLMPIQWNEPFGIVMAEAMACGTPVLGFPRGSVPEVVEDGKNGFICSDTESMVRGVMNIQAIDRRKVRQIAEEKFSNSKITDDYLSLYIKLADRRNN
jgi:glycosyltransferase involved in cell wall biosynthesis